MEFLLSKIDMMRLTDFEKRVHDDKLVKSSTIFGLQSSSWWIVFAPRTFMESNTISWV